MKKNFCIILCSLLSLLLFSNCGTLCQKPAWYPDSDEKPKNGVVSLTGSEIVLFGVGEGVGEQKIAESQAKNNIREVFKKIVDKTSDQFLKKYPEHTNLINTFKSVAEGISADIFNKSQITQTYKCDMTQQYFVMAQYKIDLGMLKMPPALTPFFNKVANDFLQK